MFTHQSRVPSKRFHRLLVDSQRASLRSRVLLSWRVFLLLLRGRILLVLLLRGRRILVLHRRRILVLHRRVLLLSVLLGWVLLLLLLVILLGGRGWVLVPISGLLWLVHLLKLLLLECIRVILLLLPAAVAAPAIRLRLSLPPLVATAASVIPLLPVGIAIIHFYAFHVAAFHRFSV